MSQPEPNASTIEPTSTNERGRIMWKSLEEVAGPGTSSVAQYIERDHPSLADQLADPVARRDVFRLLGASVALAGFSACTRQPDEKILPYARNPEALLPGVPLHYATAMPWAGGALGLLVESHMGRPTKIEGNEQHPTSQGATDAFAQAAILQLYDPDRSATVKRTGRLATWGQLLTELTSAVGEQSAKQGAGLRVLTNAVVSPTLAAQLGELLTAMPKARWIQHEPIDRDNERAGAMLAFGADVHARHDFSRASVVVALDADFLGAGPSSVADARSFAAARRARSQTRSVTRLYSAESMLTMTGAMADHRISIKPSELPSIAAEIARRLSVSFSGGESAALSPAATAFVADVVADLGANRGASLVVAGRWAPAGVHALAHAINGALGNVGTTVEYTDPIAPTPADSVAGLRSLVDDMSAGAVELLVVLGANPLYDAPADLRFADALSKVPMRVHLGLYEDETAALCHWHVNEAHFLESWSDARAHDGSAAIVQPLIAPLYGGRGAHEIVNALLGKPGVSAYDTLRATWKQHFGDADFEKQWRRALHDGVIPNTALAARTVALQPLDLPAAVIAGSGEVEFVLRPDACAWDGRYVNNGWLQELPRPITKLVWDNVARISEAMATRLGLTNGDVIEIEVDGRKLEAPVWITPGQAGDCVALTLGYGRREAGKVGSNIGYDAYAIRIASSPWSARGSIRKTGSTYELVTAQIHHDMKERDLVRIREVGKLDQGPGAHGAHAPAAHDAHGDDHRVTPPINPPMLGLSGRSVETGDPHPDLGHSLFPAQPYTGRAWAMVIDLSVCIGCSACSIACQAENNIPVVGKSQVAKNREMHWIRVDRYFESTQGGFDGARVRFQPIPCMQCENAPCELVCPVAATAHSPEGLNDMAYNRCVGTKYCMNNCPYKVRRFNYLLYSDFVTESLKLQRNPNVTVRSRGVMEKCTYCVQRINRARIQAAKEDNRPIQDGEVTTACASACPTRAITFGDMNDKSSRVSKLREEPHHYGILEDLNTRPRTTYLAKVENLKAAH